MLAPLATRRELARAQNMPTSVLYVKGSNMIVCVLLVSNSRGCCLAAPGMASQWGHKLPSLTRYNL